jgi:hypothetical protein
MRRPPEFTRQSIPTRAQGADHRRKQQRFADGDDLRLKTLLRGLRPEGREVRRDHVACDDLAIRRLEGGNLRGEVVVHHLVAAGIVQPVTGLRERGRQAELGIAPRIAVSIVREQPTDDLVGGQAAP